MNDDTAQPREGWTFPNEGVQTGTTTPVTAATHPRAPELAGSAPPAVVGIVLATLIGVLASGIALVVGIAMAVHSVVIQCPDGTISDDDSDPVCHSYPHAGQGAGIALLGVALGCLILLVSYLARRVAAQQAAERAAQQVAVQAADS